MKLSLEFWLTLNFLQEYAKKFRERMSSILFERMTNFHGDGDKNETALLLHMLTHLDSSGAIPEIHVQQEWTGGDSSNPKNFTVREPNIVGISHTFPKEVTDKYRDKSGELKLPHTGPPTVWLLRGSTYWGEEGGTSSWLVRGYLFKPDAELHLARLQAWLAKETLDKSLFTLAKVLKKAGPDQYAWEQAEKARRSALRTPLDAKMWQHMNVAETVVYQIESVPISIFGDVPV